MQKKKILATGVLALVIAGGGLIYAVSAAAAQESDSGLTFLGRVAEIVGVSEKDLRAAGETAREEGYHPERGEGMMGGHKGDFRGRMIGKADMVEDLSGFLEVDVSEIETRLDDGELPHEIIESEGKTHEEFHEYRVEQGHVGPMHRLEEPTTQS